MVSGGDFSFLESQSLDFVYSQSVSVHLDFYELYLYIKEVSRVLKPRAKLYFDFADLDRVEFEDSQYFREAVGVKKEDPYSKNCMHFNSAGNVKRALKALGFKIMRTENMGRFVKGLYCLKR